MGRPESFVERLCDLVLQQQDDGAFLRECGRECNVASGLVKAFVGSNHPTAATRLVRIGPKVPVIEVELRRPVNLLRVRIEKSDRKGGHVGR